MGNQKSTKDRALRMMHLDQGWPLGKTTWAALINFTMRYKKY